MKKLMLTTLFVSTFSVSANDKLPTAIDCYQTATNAENIGAYTGCFADDMVMVDVGRTFFDRANIQSWAEREVIPNGKTFKYLTTQAGADGYAKTSVKWMSWEADYYFWWNAEGKITKMSLQYQGTKDLRDDLPVGVKTFFDGVASQNVDSAVSQFADDVQIRIAGMRFDGKTDAKSFLNRDVIGGFYTLEKITRDGDETVVDCLFQPKGWDKPEPAIEYRFTEKDGKVVKWTGKYR